MQLIIQVINLAYVLYLALLVLIKKHEPYAIAVRQAFVEPFSKLLGSDHEQDPDLEQYKPVPQEEDNEFIQQLNAKAASSSDTLAFMNNLSMINAILMGMTQGLKSKCDSLEQGGEEEYYRSEKILGLLAEEKNEDMLAEIEATEAYDVNLKQFTENFSECCIQGYSVDDSESVHVTEFAPYIFRNIRKGLISERVLFQSLIPNRNMKGIYNFKTGAGKSPSFFFFPDNNLLMLKTLKESEKEILFSKGFLLDYFRHCVQNQGTLLMKILGVYEIEIGKSGKTIPFILTENMVGLDHGRVLRCFDLKGSLHGRYTKISTSIMKTGSGLTTLKDKNFLMLNKVAEERRLVNIPEEKRIDLLNTMLADTELLAAHGLIDYSLFLIQVDRTKIFRKNERQPFLFFDKDAGIFKFVLKELPEEAEEIKEEDGPRKQTRSLSRTTSKLKSAVFKVIEDKETARNEAFSGLSSKGFADIESSCGNYRYKLGVIDFLTTYNYAKYLENQVKSTISQVDRTQISAIDEKTYQSRFIKFMRDHI